MSDDVTRLGSHSFKVKFKEFNVSVMGRMKVNGVRRIKSKPTEDGARFAVLVSNGASSPTASDDFFYCLSVLLLVIPVYVPPPAVAVRLLTLTVRVLESLHSASESHRLFSTAGSSR